MEIRPVTLAGSLVQLEPLSLDHLEDLQEASADGQVWKLWYTFVPSPEGMEAEIKHRLELLDAGLMVPFATRRLSDNKVIGMTSFADILRDAPRLEIGYTWNAASTQRTGTNIESKFLLLKHCFEELECISVIFKTHKFNMQSRTAIEAIGASLDGILRNDRRMADGSVRDTAQYSIIREEWPAVQNLLNARLEKYL